jgi:alcohol dehydrogenase class IV
MGELQVNEGLLADVAYFADERRRMIEFFGFEQRRVIFGEGALHTLGQECGRLGAGRVFLVRDPGIEALEAPVRAALGEVEVVGVYDDIVPNPTVDSVDRFAARMGTVECDAVVALGGGSTLDTVKTGLCVASAGGSVADLLGIDLVPEAARWPLIAIPTTAGTGSEVSRGAVVADESGKKGVISDHLWPRVAIVDPQMSRDMPPGLTATTGLDALGHAIECMASKLTNSIGDAVAREALQAGCPWIVRAIEKGAEDPQARYQMARCSLLAGLLLSHINTGAAHALGYGIEKLSAAAGRPVPHGTAVALMLPGVMRHNMAAVADKYYYAAGVAGLDLGGRSREEGVRMAAGWVDHLRRAHTPFGSLQTAGLGADHIPQMVEIGLSVRRLMDQNPVEVSAAEAAAIYRGVLT